MTKTESDRIDQWQDGGSNDWQTDFMQSQLTAEIADRQQPVFALAVPDRMAPEQQPPAIEAQPASPVGDAPGTIARWK